MHVNLDLETKVKKEDDNEEDPISGEDEDFCLKLKLT